MENSVNMYVIYIQKGQTINENEMKFSVWSFASVLCEYFLPG